MTEVLWWNSSGEARAGGDVEGKHEMGHAGDHQSVRAVLAVHGGAGGILSPSPARIARCNEALAASLKAGLAVLAGDGSALDAVVAAVRVLEDDEEFNAGRGSVLTATGTVEMDAAVADGATGRVGAVGAVSGVRNPVELARAVLDEAGSVLIVGPAVIERAAGLGLALEPETYFITDRRRQERVRQGQEPSGGTVGAVARDGRGNVAAATSTGGRPGKDPGRIGDSPIPGAGTWAANATCAVSATGDGEAILLAALAHEVDSRLRLTGSSLDEACRAALDAVAGKGGKGGCIALSSDGHLSMPFTTAGMFRGWADEDGSLRVGAMPGELTALRQ
jgi:beta-aspartyl-peptidase (threonine type)